MPRWMCCPFTSRERCRGILFSATVSQIGVALVERWPGRGEGREARAERELESVSSRTIRLSRGGGRLYATNKGGKWGVARQSECLSPFGRLNMPVVVAMKQRENIVQ